MLFSKYLEVSQNKIDNNNVFWICWMFFLWGVASSMIFTLLPLFVVDELGGGYKSFGVMEGGVVLMSFMSKLFAGIIIDIFKRKKPMLVYGTVFTVFSKIALAFAGSVLFCFVAKAVDRFAKGLRTASTDAILADLSTKHGFAYSLKYMMNISGALVGSIITSCIVIMFGNNYRLIFALAIIPTIFAYIILRKKMVYEVAEFKKKKNWNIRDIKMLPSEYWHFIIIISILMFARFSEGFITLRAKEVMPYNVANFPIFMAIYEICVVCVSIPIGKISDKFDKKLILLYGILVLMITDIVAIFAHNNITTILIYIGAGIHMGATQGILASVIAESSSKHMIGTAFAIYYAIDGVCLFFSNYLAGVSSNVALWVGLDGSSGPFIQGAIAALAACCYIIYLIKKERKHA